MIIDVHAHLGVDFSFDDTYPEDELIRKMENGCNVQIVQPGATHTLKDAALQHDAIAELCRKHPGRFFGMANPNPHLPRTEYEQEMERCVKKLSFVAVKLHTLACGVHPALKAGRMVIETARELGIPVMVHTGACGFASPINLLGVAKEFSGVKIVMAHGGEIALAEECAAVLSVCPNVYGDTSWVPGFTIRTWLRAFGHRMMFASDMPDNYGTELSKMKTCGLNKDEQDGVFWRTAVDVFGLDGMLPE
jgi:predicted TIM-barrel fold metal-dependent hydrolase